MLTTISSCKCSAARLIPTSEQQQMIKEFDYSMLNFSNTSGSGDIIQSIGTRLQEISLYRHKVITQGDIRVLRILPGQQNEDIVCELKPVSFGSQLHAYDALSYVWGSYETLESMPKIIIQETAGTEKTYTAMAVRENLYKALKQLRHPIKYLDCWADAMCIDYQNSDERVFQVALMKDIYEKANRVLIWLGHKVDYTLGAFQCVRMLKEANFEKYLIDEHYPQLHCFQLLLSNTWFSRRWIIQEVAFARNALIFSGPAWVYWSEFTKAATNFFTVHARVKALDLRLSQHKQSYHYSIQAAKVLIQVTTSFSRSDLSRQSNMGSQSQNQSSTDRDFHTEELYSQIALRNIAELPQSERPVNFKSSATEYTYKFTLEELIDILYPHEVSDYRDIIYAVLSLAKDTHPRCLIPTELMADSESSTKYFHHIWPDYNKDKFEVFKEFIKYCTQRQSEFPLDIICRPWVPRSIQRNNSKFRPLAGNTSKLQIPNTLNAEPSLYTRHLASWMPTINGLAFDYTQSPERMNGDSLVGPPGHSVYCATKPFTINVNFGESEGHSNSLTTKSRISSLKAYTVPTKISDGTLSARGILLDIIGKLGMPHRGTITEEWLLIGGWSGKRRIWRRPKSVPEAFWRTVVAGRDSSEKTSAKPAFRDACKQAVKSRDEHNNINTIIPITRSQHRVAKFFKRVNDVAWNRRLLRTKNMQLLGLGPAGSAEGDVVCVLYGCSTPVILRATHDDAEEETGEHILIGECYLDGMMDGEAVNDLRLEQAKRDGSERVFVLR